MPHIYLFSSAISQVNFRSLHLCYLILVLVSINYSMRPDNRLIIRKDAKRLIRLDVWTLEARLTRQVMVRILATSQCSDSSCLKMKNYSHVKGKIIMCFSRNTARMPSSRYANNSDHAEKAESPRNNCDAVIQSQTQMRENHQLHNHGMHGLGN